jgi:taurine transport system substrate-binding protein
MKFFNKSFFNDPKETNMRSKTLRTLGAIAAVTGLLSFGAAHAQEKTVTFAHQDMLVPLRLVMESGEVEKATGYKINWRMFSGGGDVIRAMASGDVQMGEVGSSPLTAAASQGQDIKAFWVSADIADAEALVVRNGSGVNSLKDLKGKRVGVPFVSTAHYQLMAALKHDGVAGKELNVMNMRPPEIAAAWERGDIDATFVWDPVLSKVKAKGKVIATSGSVGKMGFPTFEAIAVNAKWAAENEAFMVAFVKALNRATEQTRAQLKGWTPDSAPIKAIAKWTKADPKDVPAAMALYRFPTAQEQLSAQWLQGGVAKAMGGTAEFLKEQGRIPAVKPSYAAYVTDAYVRKALGK